MDDTSNNAADGVLDPNDTNAGTNRADVESVNGTSRDQIAADAAENADTAEGDTENFNALDQANSPNGINAVTGEPTDALEVVEGEAKVRKDIVPAHYRKLYQEQGGNCGDFIAAELSTLIESGGIDALNSVKEENGIATGAWASLNNGQQRMNLSNRLRAAFLRGETIKIGGKQHDLNALVEEFGEVDFENDEQADRFLSFASMPETDRNRRALVRLFVTTPAQATAKAKRIEEAAAKKAEKEAAKAAAAEKAATAKAEKAAKGDEGDAEKAEGAETTEVKPKGRRQSKKAKEEAEAQAAAAAAEEEAAAADANGLGEEG